MGLKHVKGDSTIGYLEAEKRKEDKKNLKFFDHTSQQYEPIKKNLYIEARELTNMTERQVI